MSRVNEISEVRMALECAFRNAPMHRAWPVAIGSVHLLPPGRWEGCRARSEETPGKTLVDCWVTADYLDVVAAVGNLYAGSGMQVTPWMVVLGASPWAPAAGQEYEVREVALARVVSRAGGGFLVATGDEVHMPAVRHGGVSRLGQTVGIALSRCMTAHLANLGVEA